MDKDYCCFLKGVKSTPTPTHPCSLLAPTTTAHSPSFFLPPPFSFSLSSIQQRAAPPPLRAPPHPPASLLPPSSSVRNVCSLNSHLAKVLMYVCMCACVRVEGTQNLSSPPPPYHPYHHTPSPSTSRHPVFSFIASP